MRSLGTVALPSAVSFESTSDVVRRCNEYAKAKALDDLKSGTISTLDSFQNNVDACTASIDRTRQIRQLLILTVGLSLAGYVGYRMWRSN